MRAAFSSAAHTLPKYSPLARSRITCHWYSFLRTPLTPNTRRNLSGRVFSRNRFSTHRQLASRRVSFIMVQSIVGRRAMIARGLWLKVGVITLLVIGSGEKTYAAYNIPFTPTNNTQYDFCTTEWWADCTPFGHPFAWFDAYWKDHDFAAAQQMCTVLNHFPYYKIFRTQEPYPAGCNGATVGKVLCSTVRQVCSAKEKVHGCWTQPPNPIPPLPHC